MLFNLTNLTPSLTLHVLSEMRRRTVNPMEDPDYLLIVRASDHGENSLMGTTEVHIVVEENLWVNPGPISVTENAKGAYPMVIAKVCEGNTEALHKSHTCRHVRRHTQCNSH